jgi:hypothetical protein
MDTNGRDYPGQQVNAAGPALSTTDLIVNLPVRILCGLNTVSWMDTKK